MQQSLTRHLISCLATGAAALATSGSAAQYDGGYGYTAPPSYGYDYGVYGPEYGYRTGAYDGSGYVPYGFRRRYGYTWNPATPRYFPGDSGPRGYWRDDWTDNGYWHDDWNQSGGVHDYLTDDPWFNDWYADPAW